MDKKTVLMLSRHFPLTMARYFENAFRLREDVELVTVGPYTGSWIPWLGGMYLDNKYANPPSIQFPQHMSRRFPYEFVKVELDKRGIKPDLIVTVDAGIHWAMRPNENCPVVHVATDPHVLDYGLPRSYSDFFFNMQSAYMQNGDIHLPYAFDDTWCYREELPKEYDAALVGMPYPNRVNLVNNLRAKGLKVAFENGPVFDEYRKLNNKARIGLNWSSLNDLTCRVFEIMGMGLIPIVNNVPELSMHFRNGEHYLGFDTMDEAVASIVEVAANPDDYNVMWSDAMKLVYAKHTYRHRVAQIMETVYG